MKTKTKTVNIVGAGLAGSIMAAVLEEEGIPFRIIDDEDVFAGSRASSNLFIASWLNKFKGEEAGPGMATLQRLYSAVIERPFQSGLGQAMKVMHIPQRHILRTPTHRDSVTKVDDNGVRLLSKVTCPGPTIICTGHRAAELDPAIASLLSIKVGHAFFFHGTLNQGQSRLALAPSLLNGTGIPFRHEKLYQYAPEVIYYADSVAVSYDTYIKQRQRLRDETLARARKLVGPIPVIDFKIGYRPIVKDAEFGYTSRPSPNVWHINGGGKNGMVAYAFQAGKVLAQLEEIL